MTPPPWKMRPSSIILVKHSTIRSMKHHRIRTAIQIGLHGLQFRLISFLISCTAYWISEATKTGPVESKKAHFSPTKAGLRGRWGSSAWKYQAPIPVAQAQRLAFKKKNVVGMKQTIRKLRM